MKAKDLEVPNEEYEDIFHEITGSRHYLFNRRWLSILYWRMSGLSWEEVGEKHGISKNRARQIAIQAKARIGRMVAIDR